MQFIQAQQVSGAVLTGPGPKKGIDSQSDGLSGNGTIEDAFANVVEALSQQVEQGSEQVEPHSVSVDEAMTRAEDSDVESIAQPVAAVTDQTRPRVTDLIGDPDGKAKPPKDVEQDIIAAQAAPADSQVEAGLEQFSGLPQRSVLAESKAVVFGENYQEGGAGYSTPSVDMKDGDISELLPVANERRVISETPAGQFEAEAKDNPSGAIGTLEGEAGNKELRFALAHARPAGEVGEELRAFEKGADVSPQSVTAETAAKSELKAASPQLSVTRNTPEPLSTIEPESKETLVDTRRSTEVTADVKANSAVEQNRKQAEHHLAPMVETRLDRRVSREESFRREVTYDQRASLQASTMDRRKMQSAPELLSSAQTPILGLVSSEQGLLLGLDSDSAIPVDEMPLASLSSVDQRMNANPQLGRAPIDLPRQISAQLIDVVRTGGDKPIELQLHPEELGRVRLTFQTDASSLNVVLQMERPETLELMRRHIELLAQDIRELGYEDVNFSFQQGDGAFENGDQDGEKAADLSGSVGDIEAAAEEEAKMLRLSVGESDRMDIRL